METEVATRENNGPLPYQPTVAQAVVHAHDCLDFFLPIFLYLFSNMLPLEERRRFLVGVLAVLSGLVGTAECCVALMALNEEHCRRRFLTLTRLFSFERTFQWKIRRHGQRTCWVRPGRTSAWWDNFENDIVLPVEWRENFRMGKENFCKLCDELAPYLERQRTRASRST